MQAFYDGMTLVGTLVVMVAVIVLTYYASRWYARRMNQTAGSRHIKIIDRVTLTPGCSIAIVQAGEGFYLVGLSEKNMQMLCELPGFDPGSAVDATAQAAFGDIFQGFLGKMKGQGNPKDNGGPK